MPQPTQTCWSIKLIEFSFYSFLVRSSVFRSTTIPGSLGGFVVPSVSQVAAVTWPAGLGELGHLIHQMTTAASSLFIAQDCYDLRNRLHCGPFKDTWNSRRPYHGRFNQKILKAKLNKLNTSTRGSRWAGTFNTSTTVTASSSLIALDYEMNIFVFCMYATAI